MVSQVVVASWMLPSNCKHTADEDGREDGADAGQWKDGVFREDLTNRPLADLPADAARGEVGNGTPPCAPQCRAGESCNPYGYCETTFHDVPGGAVTMVRIPAGEFTSGNGEWEADGAGGGHKCVKTDYHAIGVDADNAGWTETECPHNQVALSEYYIDKCPISTAQFVAFVDWILDRGQPVMSPAAEAGGTILFGCQVGGDSQDGSYPCPTVCLESEDPWSDEAEELYAGRIAGRLGIASVCQVAPSGTRDSSCESHPMACVGYDGFRAYCLWRSQLTGVQTDLCTVAQFERAGTGSAHHVFFWGDEYLGARDVAAGSEPPWTAQTARANCAEEHCGDGFANTSPVGFFEPRGGGAIGSGAQDMGGNVQEYLRDLCSNPRFLRDASPTMPNPLCCEAAECAEVGSTLPSAWETLPYDFSKISDANANIARLRPSALLANYAYMSWGPYQGARCCAVEKPDGR
jgi:formylglycine-generating enzyme required for sulfatase activity